MTDYHAIVNSGKLYKVDTVFDEGFDDRQTLQQMERYNSLGYTEEAEAIKQLILRKVFAEVGEGAYIQAPYYAMLGGHNVHLGKNVYVNFNATFIDDAEIYIGDGSMLAPNVTLITAMHPVSPALRTAGYGYNKPVYIGKNVWLAAGVTVLPGVHIGDNTVVGAGALVTKDLPANVLAMGNPAVVVREITPEDDELYDHGKLIAENMFE